MYIGEYDFDGYIDELSVIVPNSHLHGLGYTCVQLVGIEAERVLVRHREVQGGVLGDIQGGQTEGHHCNFKWRWSGGINCWIRTGIDNLFHYMPFSPVLGSNRMLMTTLTHVWLDPQSRQAIYFYQAGFYSTMSSAPKFIVSLTRLDLRRPLPDLRHTHVAVLKCDYNDYVCTGSALQIFHGVIFINNTCIEILSNNELQTTF